MKSVFQKALLSSLLAVAFLAPGLAGAQGMNLDARAGNWMALHHTDEGGLNTDVCVSFADNQQHQQLAFRSSQINDHSIEEIRIVDPKWNLASDAKGEATITVGSYTHSFPMQAADNTMLGGVVETEDLKDLLNALEKANSVSVVLGHKTKMAFPLTGSKKVLDAYRGCVNSAGLDKLGSGSDTTNPF